MSAAPEEKIRILALAVANGTTIRAWAGEHCVPERTAYAWASKPRFKALVARHRREMVDRAVGRLSNFAGAAATTLGQLMQPNADGNDAIRLQAAKSVLSCVIELTSHADLEARIAAMEATMAPPGGIPDGVRR